jgi:mannose-6-phosphate isomerase-like protein (cupin superfamily)
MGQGTSLRVGRADFEVAAARSEAHAPTSGSGDELTYEARYVRKERVMICRHCTQGQRLDVAGLNEITVLVDRSETRLTEVGLNTWRRGLEGPPHSHEAKEQVFYVTAGQGVVVVGQARYAVKPGSLVYVPPRVVHQTIVTGGEALSYLLFNAFLDESKEGHASFADHIQRVKQVRREQAETQRAEVAGAGPAESTTRPGLHVEDIRRGRVYDFGSNTSGLVLERSETARCEVTLVTWPRGNRGAMVAHAEKEQTFFVLAGRGRVTVADETSDVGVGHVVFVPWNTPHTTEASDETLEYLCLNTHVTEARESSFEEMYHRVAPGRIARWKSGSTAVGD